MIDSCDSRSQTSNPNPNPNLCQLVEWLRGRVLWAVIPTLLRRLQLTPPKQDGSLYTLHDADGVEKYAGV